jgi:hypothetical protein
LVGFPPHGPRLPPSSSRPRPGSRWAVRALVAVLVLVIVVFVGLFVYLNPLPGSNCTDWYVYCPTGPGATPLGTAFQLGNGTGGCPAGNGSSALYCAYSFSVRVEPWGDNTTPVPSANDLSFQLQNASGARLDASYLITLLSEGASRLGSWNSSTSTWLALAPAGACGGSNCLQAPLTPGDSLLLQAVPSGGLPYSGDLLLVEAEGGGFTGTVTAPMT